MGDAVFQRGYVVLAFYTSADCLITLPAVVYIFNLSKNALKCGLSNVLFAEVFLQRDIKSMNKFEQKDFFTSTIQLMCLYSGIESH